MTFPQRVGIGDVSCPAGTTCTGMLGLNNMTLAVGGKIGARGGVYVVNYGGQWPDYVFSPSYHLRPLAEVAQFIEANHRLPDVPSAAQVQTEGIELTAMNAVLLQKVEELTLHLIELAKANQTLAARVAQLEVAK